MNKLHLSEEVQNDLLEIKTYIEEELLNPSAALATVSKITKKSPYFAEPRSGRSFAIFDCRYREQLSIYLSGNYISFYRAYGNEVYIDRILYARRDYMRILFGDSTTKE